MASLLESYKNRIALAESVYSKAHQGAKMDNMRKLTLARVLENTSKFMNEAFENSVGTQRTALGDYKKFALNLTTVALPNSILPELMIVQPMSSLSGYITYLNYQAGTNKGGVAQGDHFNGVFSLGEMTEARQTYTSEKVVESVTSFTSGTTKVAWFPVVAGTIRALDANGVEVSDNATTAWTASDDGTITAGAYVSGKSASDVAKFAYVYDNVYIPQNDLPIINAKLETIALTAKARRIAIYYSQIAAFQAKTDYGFDLGDQLAAQAQGELVYEIDSEGVKLLVDAAESDAELTWSKTLPVGVNKMDHYAGFAELLEIAKAKVYKRTQKFAPNYMIIAADVLPVITFIPGFNAAPAGVINGPYFAGTLNGFKVFVSPMMADGEFVIGVNGSDMQTSAAVYAPYMAIVPTQLLGFADGGMSQGFSTMYDMKILSKYVKNGVEYSPLLIKGQVTA